MMSQPMRESTGWLLSSKQGDDSIMMNPVFENIPILTSTPKKSDKRHNSMLKHLNKDEDMKTWPPDRLLCCLSAKQADYYLFVCESFR